VRTLRIASRTCTALGRHAWSALARLGVLTAVRHTLSERADTALGLPADGMSTCARLSLWHSAGISIGDATLVACALAALVAYALVACCLRACAIVRSLRRRSLVTCRRCGPRVAPRRGGTGSALLA
jgi:hypothetical protein